MTLEEIQVAFKRRILDRTSGVEAHLRGVSGSDFESRLATYVEGYRSRLLEALGTSYPALKATLGEETFERWMREYIDATPSRSYSVRYYGDGVADHILKRKAHPDRVNLSALARFEWLLADVFDAADDEPLRMEELARVPPEQWPHVVFRFRASVRRAELTAAGVEQWRLVNELPPRDIVEANEVPWLLWRKALSTRFRSLDTVEREVLDAAIEGEPFGALCERLAVHVPPDEVALRSASLLRGWIDEELVASISY